MIESMLGLLNRKPKIEPRVSDETLASVKNLTGKAFDKFRSQVIRFYIDGQLFDVSFDDQGNAGPAVQVLGDGAFPR